MKKLLTPIILCLFLMFSLTTKSQILGIDSSSLNLISLPDTINLNDNYQHTIVIQNNSATPLTGTIYLVAAVDTAGTLNSIDTVGTVSVTNFGLNDTIAITYNETYNIVNGYKIAGNIVVVWPIANSGTTSDTLTKEVYIIDPLAINESRLLKNRIIVYPNPTKDYIFIKNGYSKNKVKRVRIYTLNGQLIYNEKYNSKIDVSHLPKGLYFLKLEIKDEDEFYYKLIKE